MKRVDGRALNEMRKINVIPDFVSSAETSFLVEVGKTRILCNATLDEDIPRWLRGSGKGWVTAEYSLLPRATLERVRRERGKVSGRTMEIQRLVGRSLRGICDLSKLGERQIIIDCDVIEADGGTRTASIFGGFLALATCIQNKIPEVAGKGVLRNYLAAVSVGIVSGKSMLDLCYAEDSAAEVDMNVAMTAAGDFVEVQGTGEEAVFSRDQFNDLLKLAEEGCETLFEVQKKFLPKLP